MLLESTRPRTEMNTWGAQSELCDTKNSELSCAVLWAAADLSKRRAPGSECSVKGVLGTAAPGNQRWEILQHLRSAKAHCCQSPALLTGQHCTGTWHFLKEHTGHFLGRAGHLELRDATEGKFTALRALFRLLPNPTLELQHNCN